MCRFSGFWDLSKQRDYDLTETVCSMRDVLSAGGPDDAGFYTDEISGIALGHRRLSILDLSMQGHQPMWDDDRRYCIIFNGEIYNFQLIKSDLIKQGVIFHSNCDTEVALKAFIIWGRKAFTKFRGMFAIALWDQKEKNLILVRDRLGIKPLYWYFSDQLFMFSSEVKSFSKHHLFHQNISSQALSAYLTLGYVPDPMCIFENCHKLLPGYILCFSEKEGLRLEKYWDIQNIAESVKEFSAEDIEKEIMESIRLRLIADVRVGLFFSGGIDSTALLVLLDRMGVHPETFTIGFENHQCDESGKAAAIASEIGVSHNVLMVTDTQLQDEIENTARCFGEPFGDSSAIPVYLLSRYTAQSVKVVLGGDGGDEVFAGYDRYRYCMNFQSGCGRFLSAMVRNVCRLLSVEQMERLLHAIFSNQPNLRNRVFKLRQLASEKRLFSSYEALMSIFQLPEILDIQKNTVSYNLFSRPERESDMKSLQIHDFLNYLPGDLLTKIDRTSMNFGLEVRVPLIDHVLVEKVFGAEKKVADTVNFKRLLKKIIGRKLKNEFWDRPKQGFAIPVDRFIHNQTGRIRSMASGKLAEHVDSRKISELISRFQQGKVSAYQLYLLLVLGIWLETLN